MSCARDVPSFSSGSARAIAPLARSFVAAVLLLTLTLSAASGCGAGSAPDPAPDPALTLSFPSEPADTVLSSSGSLRIAVGWSPAMPVRGVDAAQLTVADALGNPYSGLRISVVPWMPAHGHGTSAQPVITETAPGVFVATPLYLFMSGQWQLRLTFTGALADEAIATVEIP